MAFAQDFTFNRGSGKTRTNAAGLIVGVDFSSTSNTIAVGSKTFGLAADANVNRDWPVGSNVIAVAQGGEGSMTGTVTSYVPSTQTLVLNIASVTGTGTSTNWRLGSLEIARDVVSGGVSSHAGMTNQFTYSEQFDNPAWIKSNVTLSPNVLLAPTGSVHADRIVEDIATTDHSVYQGKAYTAGSYYTHAVYAKKAERDWLVLTFSSTVMGTITRAWFNLNTGLVGSTANSPDVKMEHVGDGWYRCAISKAATLSATGNTFIGLSNADGVTTYAGDGSSGIYVIGAQFNEGSLQPYAPTTTAQVTTLPDAYAFTAALLAKLRQGESTLYVEAESDDVGPTQKRMARLSGPSGDIRIAKRGVGNFTGFTKMLEVENNLFFGVGVGSSQRCNGKEMASFQAINERTGLATTVGSMQAIAYDGSAQIMYSGGNTENQLDKTLTTVAGKGIGALNFNRGHYFPTTQKGIITTTTAGIVILSSEGKSFRRLNTPVITGALNAVVTAEYTPGVYRSVAVGDLGHIVYSDTGGETWVLNAPNTGTVNLTDIAFGAGKYVVTRESATNNIQYSANGASWTNVSGNRQLFALAHNGTNLFVAVGEQGRIQTSPDGVNWTNRTSGTTETLVSVYFANGLWLAGGNAGTLLSSPDGVAWAPVSSGTGNTIRTITYFNGLYILCINNGIIRTSANGATFTARTTNLANDLDCGVPFPASLVVGGAGGSLATSTNGTSYAPATNENSVLNGMAFGAGNFVSVGAAQGGSGYITTIDVLGNYQRRTSGTTQNLNRARYLRSIFYAVGNASALTTSPTGETWSAQTIGGTAFAIQDIADNGTLLIAVGSGGRYSTSTDGSSFSASALTGLTTQQLNGIAAAAGKFVVVGNAGVILTTNNGGQWVQAISGTTQNLTSVMFSQRDQLWYAAGAAGTLLYSADAATWLPVQNAGFGSIDNTTLQVAQNMPVFRTGRNRIAISFKNNQVVLSLNGVSKVDSLASIPSITAGALAENLNGLIHKAKIYPKAMSEFEINALTGV